MPELTRTKQIVVLLAGDPNDTLHNIGVEPGVTPSSVFRAMGLEPDAQGKFQYQLGRPGNKGFFDDNENVFAPLEGGEKLTVVPKNPVSTGKEQPWTFSRK